MLRNEKLCVILIIGKQHGGECFTESSEGKNAKNRIADALVDLIKNKRIEEITVAEITKLANVGKSTFYRHYHDIYDVFDYLSNGFVNRVCGVMLAVVLEYSAADFKDIPDSIDYRTIMTMFGLRDADTVLVDYLFSIRDAKVFRSVVKHFVEAVGNYARENNLNADAVEFCTRFIMNGIYYTVLTNYLDKGKFDTSLLELLKYFDISELK